MPENSKYVEQFDRVNRWYRRLVPVAEGDSEPDSVEMYRDELFAFFLNCYHLKDWIKNDPSVPHLKDQVEPFINETESLSICADVCNGLKHLTLSGSRGGHNPQIHPDVYTRWEIGTDREKVGIAFLVSTTTTEYDAVQLAFDCLMNWELFLTKHGEPA